MRKLALLMAISPLAMSSFCELPPPPDGHVDHIVYVHDGTGRIVGLPEPGKTRILDRGAVVIYDDGSVAEVDPASISGPKLREKLHVTIHGRDYIVPKPQAGRYCKLLAHQTTYVIDQDGNWRDAREPAPKEFKVRDNRAKAMADTNGVLRIVMPAWSTNAIARYEAEVERISRQLYEARNNTNGVSRVERLEKALLAKTNETYRMERLDLLTERYPDPKPLPKDAVYGKPDDPSKLKYLTHPSKTMKTRRDRAYRRQ